MTPEPTLDTEPSATTPSGRTNPFTGRAGRWGRFAPLIAAGAGVVLVVVSVVLLLHNRSLPADFGAVPGGPAQVQAAAPPAAGSAVSTASTAPAIPSTASSSTELTTTAPTTKSSTGPATPGRARNSAVATQPSPARPAATDPRALPRQLILRRLGVRADVVPITSAGGVLEVPENPQQVGWWVGSALPGSSAGTTVIDGHIDSAKAGVGAFIHLSDLAPGDSVSIVGSTGRSLDYDVVARRIYAKNAGLPASLFAGGGPGRLLLISCGGPFDSARGSYEDNIVVFATPSAA